MNIPITDFLAFATYNGLFDSVSLINYPKIEAALLEANTDKHLYHIDEHHTLWSIQGWKQECERCKNIDNTLTTFRSNYIPVEQTYSKELIKEMIKQAAIAGNFDEVMRLRSLLGMDK